MQCTELAVFACEARAVPPQAGPPRVGAAPRPKAAYEYVTAVPFALTISIEPPWPTVS